MVISSGVVPRVGIVITAAGSGTRLGYGAPKALVPLATEGVLGDDTSLFAVALRQAASISGVHLIVVTAPELEIESISAVARSLGLSVPVRVVAGSLSRQASVHAGLIALAVEGFGERNDDVVLVHDAARALAPTEMMDRVVTAVHAGSAAVIPALAVSDTIKLVAPNVLPDPSTGRQRIVGSADRTAMRIVQTPQGFPWRVLWDAHERFSDRGLNETTAATDDSTIAQWAGYEVDCVEGDDLAIKVTTTTDLALARVLFAHMRATESKKSTTNNEED